jgi:hypothetical protein
MSSDSFSTGTPLPLPLKNAACASVGEDVYVFGGFTGDVNPTDTVLVYNPVNDVWRTAPNLPYAMVNAVAASYNGQIYIAGGHYWDGSTLNVFDKLLRFVPAPVATLSMDTVYAFMQNAVYPDSIQVKVGGPFDGYTIADIDLPTIRVNDSLPALADSLDTDTDSLYFTISLSDFVASYGVKWGTTMQNFIVNGSFNSGEAFQIPGTFVFRGHVAGDLNFDGMVNVSDLTLLSGTLFDDASSDTGASLDVTGDCQVNIMDLTFLVAYLFNDGPAPTGGC